MAEVIPAEAVEAALSALFPNDASVHGFKRAVQEPIVRTILEAAAPYMLADELAAEYRRGYRDGLTDRKQVTEEPRAWEPGDPIE
jgi:hypothetical protein